MLLSLIIVICIVQSMTQYELINHKSDEINQLIIKVKLVLITLLLIISHDSFTSMLVYTFLLYNTVQIFTAPLNSVSRPYVPSALVWLLSSNIPDLKLALRKDNWASVFNKSNANLKFSSFHNIIVICICINLQKADTVSDPKKK